MQVTIVYESLYGNTHQIAEAIARGIADTRPDATVDVVPVSEVHAAQPALADLLVVGGPTHLRGMSTGLSRHLAVTAENRKDPERQHLIDGRGERPGLRDWFARIPTIGSGRPAAAFDTRLPDRFAGGAARGIARRLRQLGYQLIADPQGFLIDQDLAGPLLAGERTRAHAWGVLLARQLAPAAADSESIAAR